MYFSIVLKPIGKNKTTISLKSLDNKYIKISTYDKQSTTEYNNLPVAAFSLINFEAEQNFSYVYHNEKIKSKEQIVYDNKYNIKRIFLKIKK